jgi:hypothetical protein
MPHARLTAGTRLRLVISRGHPTPRASHLVPRRMSVEPFITGFEGVIGAADSCEQLETVSRLHDSLDVLAIVQKSLGWRRHSRTFSADGRFPPPPGIRPFAR